MGRAMRDLPRYMSPPEVAWIWGVDPSKVREGRPLDSVGLPRSVAPPAQAQVLIP